MKPVVLLCAAAFVLALAAGFGFLAVSKPPVAQKQVVKTISNERFF